MKKQPVNSVVRVLSFLQFSCILCSLTFISTNASTMWQRSEKSSHGNILVTGATGRLGILVYTQLKEQAAKDNEGGDIYEVRAFVRSAEKARESLGCTVCDETEGIYVGDVTDASTLLPATLGVSTVVIAVGVSPGPGLNNAIIKEVEFKSVENTVATLAQPDNRVSTSNGNNPLEHLRVVLCSSMGTATHDISEERSLFDDILYWKLNAEAYLGSSGVGSAIIKPCGLVNIAGGNATLITDHDDELHTYVSPPLISRTDVAAVMAQAVYDRSRDIRFDLCSKEGEPTTDLSELLHKAKWTFEQPLPHPQAGINYEVEKQLRTKQETNGSN